MVVDNNGREILTAGGAVIEVSSTTPAIGTGFSPGAAILTLSGTIPVGVSYTIFYSSRGNLATLPTDALAYYRVRMGVGVSGEVEKLLADLHGNSEAWNAPWDTTIHALSVAVAGGAIPSFSSKSALVFSSVAGLTPGTLRIVSGSQYTGIYSYQLVDANPVDGIYTLATSAGGTTRWVHLMRDLPGSNSGLATLDGSGLVVQRLSYENVAGGVAQLDATTYVAQPTRKVQRVSDVTTLRNLVSAEQADGDICVLGSHSTQSYGLYYYDANVNDTSPGAGYPDDGLLVLKPADKLSTDFGRWIHTMRSLWAPATGPGLATLDGSGKVGQHSHWEGLASGVAQLDANSWLVQPAKQLPPGVTNVFAGIHALGNFFALTGMSDGDLRLGMTAAGKPYGLYRYAAAGTSYTDAGLKAFNSTAGGQWVNLLAEALGTAGGIATLDINLLVEQVSSIFGTFFKYSHEFTSASVGASAVFSDSSAGVCSFTTPAGISTDVDVEIIVDVAIGAGENVDVRIGSDVLGSAVGIGYKSSITTSGRHVLFHRFPAVVGGTAVTIHADTASNSGAPATTVTFVLNVEVIKR
jgi:hypothetical protein